MIEVGLQTALIKAFRSGGGAAHKLSNRFLVGVSDLLVKMPGNPAWLLEVKRNKRPIRQTSIPDAGVTPIQDKFMRDFRDAGMITGVVSFLYEDRKHWIGVFWGSDGKNLSVSRHVETSLTPQTLLKSFWHAAQEV